MSMVTLRRKVEDLKRFEQICRVFFKHGFARHIMDLELGKNVSFLNKLFKKSNNVKGSPYHVRKAFEELGGAFIKLGQLLSLRPDLVPLEYCEEFKKLQDHVPPVPFERVKKIIEKDTGKSINKVFKTFTKKPLAAASVAQVHRAKLHTGEDVVVKVKRFDIQEKFDQDLDILTYVARLIEKKMQPKLIRPLEIVNEFKRYTMDELDFKNEARNISKFASNFANKKTVVVPRVYHNFSTENLIVMEFIDGINIMDVQKYPKKYNKKIVVNNLIDSLFNQIFTHACFHADPHPGNILVLPGNKIAFLDFGIVGQMSETTRDKMTVLFMALIDGDVDGVADGIIDLGMSDGTLQKEFFKQDLIDHLGRYYNVSLQEVGIKNAFNALVTVARENGIRLPSNLVLLLKAVVTMESIGEELYPKFNLVEFARPTIETFVRKEISLESLKSNAFRKVRQMKRLLTIVPEQTMDFLGKLSKGDFKVELAHQDMEHLIYEMEKTSNKVTLGVISAALLIGSSLALNLDLPLIYGIPNLAFFGYILSASFLLALMRLMLTR